ncbi:hypothetical protein V6N12_010213 [Hibiscus sabdariffa]|uniref:RNase H type-1 domain-containing protein n=1 Tax=Hibiscus sabdariffa TaxID=183260 RepID=A0ABR2AVD2_9ROSI
MLANDERLRRHLMTECRSMCGVEVVNVNQVLHFCPVTYTLGCSLVQSEYIVEFFSLPFKDWLLTNLTNFEKFCKLNSDGAVNRISGMASCGGVVRTNRGSWVIGFSKGIVVCSAIEAGLWGIYEGLLTAWLVGVLRLVLQVNSLDAIRVIQ